MTQRMEVIENGFQQWAQEWPTVFNGVLVPPGNNPVGSWGNQPGGSTIGGYFQNGDRRRVVKIGMQWQSGSYDGTGLVLQFARAAQTPGTFAWEAYAPQGIALDCAAMGLPADGIYREYVLPTPFPARGIQWFKGFDDSRIPFNGTLQKIRIFTDTWSPESAEQGSVRVLPATGSGVNPQPAGPGAWHIQTETGVTVATSQNSTTKNGWEVAWNGTQFVMKRPLTADPNAGYQVIFRE